MLNLFKYKADPDLPNKQLITLLFNYSNAVSEPEIALKWVKALELEYKSVYYESNPLIYLYEGESLEQAKHREAANANFRLFLKDYPSSIIAMVNAYATETDEKQKKVWYAKLKSMYSNHWAVKDLKME